MKTKKQMVDYIAGFDKYATMNSWNGSYGYSYNVKIHNLPLTKKQKEALYEMLDTEEYGERLTDCISVWREETMPKHGVHTEKQERRIRITAENAEAVRKQWEAMGWTYDRHGTEIMTVYRHKNVPVFDAGFNGRSGGHLVLYCWNGHNYAGTGWAHTREELEEMSAGEVREIYAVLKDFEELYEMLLAECKYMAKHYKVEKEEYTTTHERNVMVEA